MVEDIITSTFIRFKDRFLVQAKAVLRSSASAEDALMDAFLKVYVKRYPVETEGDAERLLARVVRNESISQIRHSRRDSPLEKASLVEDSPEEENGSIILRMERVMEQSLTPTQKYIVRRRDYEGASFEQIAMELDMQQPAVRKQLSRARTALREALKNED